VNSVECNKEVSTSPHDAVIRGPDIVLYPTHKCFDDAIDYLVFVAMTQGKAELIRYTLVHGILRPKHSNHGEYAHAWLELNNGTDDICLDGRYLAKSENNKEARFVMCEFDRKGYYSEMGVLEVTKYTPAEAQAENIKHENYGPWIEKYRRLCK